MSDQILSVRGERPVDWLLGNAYRHQEHCAERSVSTRRAIPPVFDLESFRTHDELRASIAEQDLTDRPLSAIGGVIARELSRRRNYDRLQTAYFVLTRPLVARASASQRVVTILRSFHPFSMQPE